MRGRGWAKTSAKANATKDENGNGDRSTFIWNDDKSAMRLSFQSPWRVDYGTGWEAVPGRVLELQGGGGGGCWVLGGLDSRKKLSDFFITH